MADYGVLSDDAIQEILGRAMEEQFSKVRPATRHFFEHQAPDEGQERTVTIHQWVIADVQPTDTREAVSHLANRAVKEVVAVARTLTGELAFRKPGMLPHQPMWSDGAALFAAHDLDEVDRFGVKGGNLLGSKNCFTDDVARAAERLDVLDDDYETGDERLQLFCAKPLEKKLIRAAAKAKIPCRVFGIYNHKEERSWVLTRDMSACSLLIGKPAFELPVKRGNKIVVGARFVVWINDPRLAVCVEPTP